MGTHNRIGRRIYVTEVDLIYYDANNERKESTVVVNGKCSSIDKAAGKARAFLGLKNAMATDYRVRSKFYSMPVETFIKYADSTTD